MKNIRDCIKHANFLKDFCNLFLSISHSKTNLQNTQKKSKIPPHQFPNKDEIKIKTLLFC
jgi:hypothetical protein